MDNFIDVRPLYAQVQMIEKHLNDSSISQKGLANLRQELEGTQNSLLADQARAIDALALAQMSELNEKISTLFGRIETLILDREVDSVKEEAEAIESFLNQEELDRGDLKKVARSVDALKKHIDTLYRNYAPSLEDRRVINIMTRSVFDKANLLLGIKNDALLSLSQMELMMEEELEPLIMELFGIADLFYHQKFKQGWARYNQLPERIKILLGVCTEELDGDMVKALLALAQAISSADNHRPTDEEVHTFFSECPN